ncbi:MAG: PxKF domain-containing protein [Candidatus Competibacteraceae bacterium]
MADKESSITAKNGCNSTIITTDTDTAGITVTCEVTSSGGTASQSVIIHRDTTPPIITAAAATSPNSDGWYNSNVGIQFTCSDAGSGVASGACPADEILSAEGHSVSSMMQTVTDQAGNTSAPSNVITVQIDKTSPLLTWNGGLAADSTYFFGFVPAVPTCTAADALSGPKGCNVSGYEATLGPHTLTATAYDAAGNRKIETRTYTVLAWTLKGFYPPVDMPIPTLVYNTVKNGSTFPMKFEIFAGATELTDVAYVKSLTYVQTNCDANSMTDDIELLATGNTVLRYDTTAGQYVYNWKTPSTASKCYRVTMTTQDGSSLIAYLALFIVTEEFLALSRLMTGYGGRSLWRLAGLLL